MNTVPATGADPVRHLESPDPAVAGLRVPWRELAGRAWPLFIARAATFAMTLAAFAIVGRHLGPARFGTYGLAFTVPLLLAPLVDYAFLLVVQVQPGYVGSSFVFWSLLGFGAARAHGVAADGRPTAGPRV